ncbi:hypothetical protein J6O48_08800 [bacterium]|nr:hypothetical protein [bacterium]
MTKIEKLMEFAQKEINNRLGTYKYTDDWQWNDRCFQFEVLELIGIEKSGKPKEKSCGIFRFIPYADEEFYGTAEEQFINWMNERF